MVARTALKKAAEELRAAICRFVEPDEQDQVQVVESSPGHLRVIVGSRKFTDVGIVERQNVVWEFLDNQVKAKQLQEEHLRLCWGVHPLDPEQYYAEHFPQDSSSSAYPGVGE